MQRSTTIIGEFLLNQTHYPTDRETMEDVTARSLRGWSNYENDGPIIILILICVIFVFTLYVYSPGKPQRNTSSVRWLVLTHSFCYRFSFPIRVIPTIIVHYFFGMNVLSYYHVGVGIMN